MSKKLVKTAKQQFEERLRELNVVREWKMCDTEIYYLCEDSKAHVCLLRDQDGEYRELSYGQQYEALVFSSRFLCAMSERFVELDIDMKPLFDWYASDDHDDEPFNLHDIYTCDLGELLFIFKDLYEEVPDVRIITAKEQWEKDSSEAKATLVIENVSYRIVLLETGIDVYIHEGENEYGKESFPPLEELRKDAEFVTNYVSYISKNRSNFMNDALKWLRGGEYVMNEWGLMDIYSVCMGYCNTSYRYEDKEEPAEVIKQYFKGEIDALREKMVAHVEQLCERGMTVNMDCLAKYIALAWGDGSFSYTEDIKGLFIEKNEKGEWIFYYSSCFYDRSSEYLLKYLPVETLQKFIEAMQ